MSYITNIIFHLFRLFNLKKIVGQMFLNPSRIKTFKFPRNLKSYKYECFLINKRNIVTFNIDSQTQEHILFFHGGAYSSEALNGHWWMIKQLLKKTNFKLTFIDYPLSPEHTVSQTHSNVISVFYKLVKNNPKDTFSFVGDSAGGGLSLSLAQTLRDENHYKSPEKIVLLSPWLDATMTNPDIIPLEKCDLVLSKKVLITVAKRFSGGLPITNYLLSPLNGAVNNMNNIAVFVGEKEILLPDCRLLKIKIEKSNTKLFYKEYEKMIHDWGLFPIPERKLLMNDVSNYLLKK